MMMMITIKYAFAHREVPERARRARRRLRRLMAASQTIDQQRHRARIADGVADRGVKGRRQIPNGGARAVGDLLLPN